MFMQLNIFDSVSSSPTARTVGQVCTLGMCTSFTRSSSSSSCTNWSMAWHFNCFLFLARKKLGFINNSPWPCPCPSPTPLTLCWTVAVAVCFAYSHLLLAHSCPNLLQPLQKETANFPQQLPATCILFCARIFSPAFCIFVVCILAFCHKALTHKNVIARYVVVAYADLCWPRIVALPENQKQKLEHRKTTMKCYGFKADLGQVQALDYDNSKNREKQWSKGINSWIRSSKNLFCSWWSQVFAIILKMEFKAYNIP